MPLPQRPMFPRSAGVVPPRARQVGPVFSVGRRMLISAEAKRRVILTDDKGAELRAAIRQGAEVEILAWQPRGVGGIRYRVRSIKDGVEGWLGAASLRAHPLPPVAAITRIAAAARPVAAAGRKRR